MHTGVRNPLQTCYKILKTPSLLTYHFIYTCRAALYSFGFVYCRSTSLTHSKLHPTEKETLGKQQSY